MADMNETSWIDTNVEVVESYLKKEFESFTIRHRTDNSQTYAFIVNDGKKRFTLLIGAPILADRGFTPARIDHLLKKNVAGEMLSLEKPAITGRLPMGIPPSVVSFGKDRFVDPPHTLMRWAQPIMRNGRQTRH